MIALSISVLFQLREQSAIELCCDIKAWGSCKKLGCNYAHNISHVNTNMIPPHIKLPTTGTIKVKVGLDEKLQQLLVSLYQFQVNHVTSAGQYWARLKEHIPVKFGDRPATFQASTQLIQLYTSLSQYHAEGKLSAPKNITVGHCYGFIDEEKVCHRYSQFIQSVDGRIFHHDKYRVQVLQLSEPLDGTMYFHKEKARVTS